MLILVGSKNASKVEGVKEAFEMYFDDVVVMGVEVDSEVPSQPVNKETMQGAKNRVKNLKDYSLKNKIEADFYVAVESGLIDIYESPVIINACYVEDNKGNNSYGFSEGFPIPCGKYEDIKNKGLSAVFDDIFNVVRTKENENEPHTLGGIFKLSNGKVNRTHFAKYSCVMALTKFLNPKWR